jgi:hypothetical protein
VRLRAGLLAAAVAGYTVAAWSVAPGFYDGFAPVPYHWVSPPPQFAHNNTPPAPGRAGIKLDRSGQSEPATVATNDDLQPQCLLSVVPGAFLAPPSGSAIQVDIKPVAAFPAPPAGVRFLSNVYLVTASQPLVKDAYLTLSYSDGQPAPSSVYRADQNGGGWTDIGSTGAAAPLSITAKTRSLGYFVAGYDAGRGAQGPRLGGGQILPIVTALIIVIVVLAGLPLAMLRRRRPPPPDADKPP